VPRPNGVSRLKSRSLFVSHSGNLHSVCRSNKRLGVRYATRLLDLGVGVGPYCCPNAGRRAEIVFAWVTDHRGAESPGASRTVTSNSSGNRPPLNARLFT
jgi:hypothetical protein